MEQLKIISNRDIFKNINDQIMQMDCSSTKALEQEPLTFVDICSGVGGFHQAIMRFIKQNDVQLGLKMKANLDAAMEAKDLRSLLHLAAEIDREPVKVYDNNYLKYTNTTSQNDVTKLVVNSDLDFRLHDFIMLIAGFPCQPFSKAGSRKGFEDKTRGTIFFNIAEILKIRIDEDNPVKFILLENVPNLVTNDNGNTYKVIVDTLHELGYVIPKDPLILSPHQFGTPQARKRMFIPGFHKSVFQNEVPEHLDLDIKTACKPGTFNQTSLHMSNVLGGDDIREKLVGPKKEALINFYDELIGLLKSEDPDISIGFPVFIDWLNENPIGEDVKAWMLPHIKKNQAMYLKHKDILDVFLEKHKGYIAQMTPTDKKLEWQAGKEITSLKDTIIQFRTSGLRTKRPTEAPTLVAMVQLPIIHDMRVGGYREITVREACRLQDFDEDFEPHEKEHLAYKQLGNSVNVKVVTKILEAMNNIDVK